MGWAAVVVVALLLASSSRPEADDWDEEFVDAPTIRSLDDKIFEHETQAATGQTSGSWLVVFISSGCLICGDVESALLDVIPKLDGGLPIVARVNISENLRTAKRFNVSKIPQLKLFRDRHMFSYGGQWSAESILSFVKEEWRNTASEDVPKEVTLVDEVQEKLWGLFPAVVKYLANRPGILAGVGTMIAMGSYLFAKQWLVKKQRQRKPRSRPRKRSD